MVLFWGNFNHWFTMTFLFVLYVFLCTIFLSVSLMYTYSLWSYNIYSLFSLITPLYLSITNLTSFLHIFVSLLPDCPESVLLPWVHLMSPLKLNTISNGEQFEWIWLSHRSAELNHHHRFHTRYFVQDIIFSLLPWLHLSNPHKLHTIPNGEQLAYFWLSHKPAGLNHHHIFHTRYFLQDIIFLSTNNFCH